MAGRPLTMVHFDQPWWLLAAVAGLAPVVLAARAGRRGRRLPAWAVALQCLAVALAGAALSRPAVRVGLKSRLPWLVLRDVSASTRGQDSNFASLAVNWPAELPREVVEFAQDVLSRGEAPLPAGPSTSLATGRSSPLAAGTRLGPALQVALGRAGELAGAVVVSDGQWQDDRWEEAADALRRTRLPVLVVPLAEPPSDARIVEFRAARRPDGKAELRVALAADAPQRRTLAVRRQGPPGRGPGGDESRPPAPPLLEREVQLLPGEPFAERLTDDGPAAGEAAVYRAELSGGDAFPENDEAAAAIPPAAPRVALVASEEAGLLAGQQDVQALSPGAAPDTPEGWAAFSCVVLCDADGSLLSLPQREALGRYVRQGGGLVIVGTGPHATAQDRQEALNLSAALVPNPYERRSLRVIVVLDASGSMGEAGAASAGRRKYDLAVEAVVSMRSHLTPRDSLAVIAFSDSARRVYDSGAAAPDFPALREAMAKVQPGGPTAVAPALEEALRAPPPAGTEGLVIVVSDLAAKPFDEPPMAERFRRQKMGLAIVEVQAGPSTPAPPRPSLRTLAGLLAAPVAPEADLGGLAEIFGRFIRLARGDVVRRGEFRLAAPAAVFGRDAAALPVAQAYVLSAQSEGAEVLASVGEDPVVARRAVGLGRSVSVALPIVAGQNAALAGSSEFRALLAGAVAWASRPPDDPRFSCEFSLARGLVRLEVAASEGGAPLNLPRLSARAISSEGQESPRGTELEQVAPGRYEARIEESARPLVVQVLGPEGQPLWTGAWSPPCPQEFSAIGPNWANLQRLAVASGGRIEPAGSLAARGRELLRREYFPLSGVLLAFAAGLMLAEWAAVRIVLR